MTCYLCNFQWCWICGGTYYRDHYNPLNPFGCGNQQFSEKRVWYKQIFINLGWLLLALILLPLLIVFAVPVGLASLVCSDRLYYNLWSESPFLKLVGLVAAIAAFCLGLALDVIVVPLIIVFGLPIAIGWICY